MGTRVLRWDRQISRVGEERILGHPASISLSNLDLPAMTRRKKWMLLGSVLGIPLLLVVAFVCMRFFNVFHAHEHCIKQAGIAFKLYAMDNDGKLPDDTNGFGNALLLLLKGGYLGDTNGQYSTGPITGPGDDGSLFRQALKTGERIPEHQCSRIYIQGLAETNNPSLAILWDRRPTAGGDHFRRPWGPLLREVCLLDGSMQVVPEKNWASFVSNQVELLVQDGIPRGAARHYYELP